MDLKTYVAKVKEMRIAHNDYFDLKKRGDIKMTAVSGELLKRSKSLEKEVDTMTAEILAGATPQQLF